MPDAPGGGALAVDRTPRASSALAVRSLLTRALDQIEGASAPTKRGGR